MEETKNTVPMLQKALDILEYIGDSPAPVTLPELQRSLGISQSSCFRIVATLVARRWLDKCAGNAYEIAPGILPVAAKARLRLEPYRRLQPALNRLANQIGYSVKFSVRDGDEFVNVCTAKTRRDALIFSEPGFRSPLDEPASVSTIMLAEAGEKDWKRLTSAAPLAYAKLRKTYARCGYCFIAGSAEKDAAYPFDTLSMPVKSDTGKLLGVVSLLSLPGVLARSREAVAAEVAAHTAILAGLL